MPLPEPKLLVQVPHTTRHDVCALDASLYRVWLANFSPSCPSSLLVPKTTPPWAGSRSAPRNLDTPPTQAHRGACLARVAEFLGPPVTPGGGETRRSPKLVPTDPNMAPKKWQGGRPQANGPGHRLTGTQVGRGPPRGPGQAPPGR